MHDSPKYILCIPGAKGIHNSLYAQLFHKITQTFDIPFDLIVGISHGTLLILLPSDQYLDLFSFSTLKKIYPKTHNHEIQHSPMYENSTKSLVLKKYFGDSCLSDKKLHTNIAVVLYNVSKNRQELFTNYDKQNYSLLSLAQASSASIPYHGAVKLSNHNQYIDGTYSGVNSSLLAFHEAQHLFGTKTMFRMLVLGANDTDRVINTEHCGSWGSIPWICNGFLDTWANNQAQQQLSETQKIMAFTNKDNRIFAPCSKIPDMKVNDVTEKNIKYLQDRSEQLFDTHKLDFQDFFNPKSCRSWSYSHAYESVRATKLS